MIRAAALIAVTWTAASVVTCAAFSLLKKAGERHNTRAAANALGIEEFDFGPTEVGAFLQPQQVPESEVRELVMAIEVLREAESVDDLAFVGGSDA